MNTPGLRTPERIMMHHGRNDTRAHWCTFLTQFVQQPGVSATFRWAFPLLPLEKHSHQDPPHHRWCCRCCDLEVRVRLEGCRSFFTNEEEHQAEADHRTWGRGAWTRHQNLYWPCASQTRGIVGCPIGSKIHKHTCLTHSSVQLPNMGEGFLF